MKLFFLITKLDYSGGPKMLAWLANQFANRGHKVCICSIYSNTCEQPLDESIEFLPLAFSQDNSWAKRNIVEMPLIIKSIRREVNFRKPDFVVSFAYSVDIFYLFLSKINKQKTIFSMRLDPYSEKGIMAKLRHNIMKMATGLVFQTEGAMYYFGRKVSKKSIVIPNPVTNKTLNYCSRVKEYTERDNIIVLPARLNIPQKRQDVAIRAYKIVHEKYPDFKLELLGDGPDKNTLYELACELQISDSVLFTKAVSSAEEKMVQCKIMILCSDYEGIPNSLIEAMSLGLCVVSTDCSPGGAKMLIQDGENGFLVARNDYRDMARKICMIIENPNMASRIGRNATKIRNDYSESSIAEQWIDFFETLL